MTECHSNRLCTTDSKPICGSQSRLGVAFSCARLILRLLPVELHRIHIILAEFYDDKRATEGRVAFEDLTQYPKGGASQTLRALELGTRGLSLVRPPCASSPQAGRPPRPPSPPATPPAGAFLKIGLNPTPEFSLGFRNPREPASSLFSQSANLH